MVSVINQEDLHKDGTDAFEGYCYGDVAVSFFLSNASPGGGPRLHRHPYAEVFVVQEGCAIFTAGDGRWEVIGGQIVIVPPGVPHKFVNVGEGPLRQVNIHASERMVTEWLED